MSAELARDLRAGMERFTEHVHVPPGLAAKAYRHRQKQRITVRAVAATGTAAAVAGTALAVTGLTGSPGSGGTTATQTTAYVISHVERALAPGSSSPVLHSTAVFSPAQTAVVPEPAATPQSSYVTLPKISEITGWSDFPQSRETAFTAGGQPVYDQATTGRMAAAGGRTFAGPFTRTVALYPAKTWASEQGYGYEFGQPPGVCDLQPPELIPYVDWPSYIRTELKCGIVTYAGHQQIGGVDAIKLVSTGKVSWQPTFWVDPLTYLPVRMTFDRSRQETETVTLQWLPPTAGNLAHLKVPIPAGFQHLSYLSPPGIRHHIPLRVPASAGTPAATPTATPSS